MTGKRRAYLELVRLPNLFTAAADPLAGFLYSGGELSDWMTWSRLALTSVLLYGAGVALNDVCDVERDRCERPSRPIPSGAVSRRAAAGVAVGLIGCGLSVAAPVSPHVALFALLLAVCIILYDVALKATPLGPGMMGLCRALNLGMGMERVPTVWSATFFLPMLLMGLYIAAVTVFARHEAGVSRRSRLVFGASGVCLAAGGLTLLPTLVTVAQPIGYFTIVWVLVAWLGGGAYRAIESPSQRPVQDAVKRFVLSIVAFDACIACAGAGPIAALAVASLLVPAMILGRTFRVT